MNETELDFLAKHCPSFHAPHGRHQVDFQKRYGPGTEGQEVTVRACIWCGILDNFIEESE